MNVCPTCQRPMPDPLATRRVTKAELRALSAWYWARTARGAAVVLRLHQQTVKNQLARARQRNQCESTWELAQTFAGQLLSMEELTSHNNRRAVA